MGATEYPKRSKSASLQAQIMKNGNGKVNGTNGITIDENGQSRYHGLEIAAVIPKSRRGPKGFIFPVEMAESMGFIGMTQEEIAWTLGVTRMTVEREFAKGEKSKFVSAYQKGAIHMRNSLRNELHKRATEGGSDAALIFALKNYCKMTDRQQIEHDGEIRVTVMSGGKPIKMPKWLKQN